MLPYPVPSYTSSGLTISTQAETLAAIEADQRASISAELDLSTSSPEGQINRITARRVRVAEEALAALFAALDPETATGDALLRVCAISGTYRKPAIATRVLVACDLDAGTYAIGALVAFPAGRPADRFSNVEEIVSVGGVSLVTFEAEIAGPTIVLADSLQIAAPVAGWNFIDGHPDGTTGSAIETEAALRLRRKREVSAPGSSSVIGIAADLSAVEGVISAYVVENDTDAVVSGQPAHSIECVVYGPQTPTATDDDAIAAVILAAKAAGIATFGTTSRTVYDSESFARTVRFTRPARVDVLPSITLVKSADLYAGDDAVKAAIAAIEFTPGVDCSWDLVVAAARTVPGVLRVVSVNLGLGAFVDVPISLRQIASIDSGDVVVSSSTGVP